MYPVLFEFFGLKLYSFGLIVALAALVAILWMIRRARQAGENEEQYLEIAFWLIISGFVGARLFYFIFFPEHFLADPLGALLSQGGLVWYGGMIAVTLTVIFYTRLKGINLWKFGDVFVPTAALALAIGRIGCLMAGCCYGAVCEVPWAIHYPHGHETGGLPVHPTPLYESFALLVVTGLLLRIDKRKPFNGLTTWMFFIIYGVVRFVIEYYRGDRLVWLESFNLSASQLISLGGILLGVVMILILRTKHQNHAQPEASAPQDQAA